jgi:hypothetical protein
MLSLCGGVKFFANTIMGKAIPVEAADDETVGKVKQKIEQADSSIHMDEYCLMYGNTEMEDDQPLSHYGLQEECVLTLVSEKIYFCFFCYKHIPFIVIVVLLDIVHITLILHS